MAARVLSISRSATTLEKGMNANFLPPAMDKWWDKLGIELSNGNRSRWKTKFKPVQDQDRDGFHLAIYD